MTPKEKKKVLSSYFGSEVISVRFKNGVLKVQFKDGDIEKFNTEHNVTKFWRTGDSSYLDSTEDVKPQNTSDDTIEIEEQEIKSISVKGKGK